MIVRLANVFYWIGFLFGAAIASLLLYMLANEGIGERDTPLVFIMMGISLAAFGLGWTLRYILAGITRLTP